jgi:hypothetical protein
MTTLFYLTFGLTHLNNFEKMYIVFFLLFKTEDNIKTKIQNLY